MSLWHHDTLSVSMKQMPPIFTFFVISFSLSFFFIFFWWSECLHCLISKEMAIQVDLKASGSVAFEFNQPFTCSIFQCAFTTEEPGVEVQLVAVTHKSSHECLWVLPRHMHVVTHVDWERRNVRTNRVKTFSPEVALAGFQKNKSNAFLLSTLLFTYVQNRLNLV